MFLPDFPLSAGGKKFYLLLDTFPFMNTASSAVTTAWEFS
jgi:hypothetical protein